MWEPSFFHKTETAVTYLARTPNTPKLTAEEVSVMQSLTTELHLDLQVRTQHLVEEIDGPVIAKGEVVDRLLDLRNVGRGRDLGLELSIDEMLESIPAGRVVSSEWWMGCLSEVADHAAFLAAGYPAVIPELASA